MIEGGEEGDEEGDESGISLDGKRDSPLGSTCLEVIVVLSADERDAIAAASTCSYDLAEGM